MQSQKILLSPKEFTPIFTDWRIDGVLNPAAVRLPNKKILLVVRVTQSPPNEKGVRSPRSTSAYEYQCALDPIAKKEITRVDGNVLFLKNETARLANISHFQYVLLKENGLEVESISTRTDFFGIPGESDFGVEDARITKIGSKYYMTYVGVSRQNGISTYLATSPDAQKWERQEVLFQEQNKDVVLFPEKIKDHYVALNRPENSMAFARPSMWISYSPDLIFWGKEKRMLPTRENSWESSRNGAGPPPIKTKKGWLIIYHGVAQKNGKNIYSAGAALLDLKNPEKVLARSPPHKPLFAPQASHEAKGYVNNVVFPTGLVPAQNSKELLVYAGAADSAITVRKILLAEVFKNIAGE